MTTQLISYQTRRRRSQSQCVENKQNTLSPSKLKLPALYLRQQNRTRSLMKKTQFKQINTMVQIVNCAHIHPPKEIDYQDKIVYPMKQSLQNEQKYKQPESSLRSKKLKLRSLEMNTPKKGKQMINNLSSFEQQMENYDTWNNSKHIYLEEDDFLQEYLQRI